MLLTFFTCQIYPRQVGKYLLNGDGFKRDSDFMQLNILTHLRP